MLRICRRLVPRLGLTALMLSVAVRAMATPVAAADPVILFRIFMLDGTTAVSYGEFARTGGNVVFSIPLAGLDSDAPQLQLVSLPDSVVDWPRTEAYARSARAKQFAETRGEAEFSRLSEEVARTLGQIAFTEDASKRLAAAERARRLLADWPERNYWYRSADVAELTTLLDGVLSELRVAAGQSKFDLSLVANTTPPPAVPMLPGPGLRESIEQAFMLTRLSQDSVQRSVLLRSITDALAEPARDGGWAAALRARATADLTIAIRTDRSYADLSARMLRSADTKVRRGDVKGVERLIAGVLEADDKLGRQRPQDTAALLATLDLRLASAHRARLLTDQWSIRAAVVRAYDRRIRSTVEVLVRGRGSLELIRQLAGPSPRTLQQFEARAATAGREFTLIRPPAELDSVHGLLSSAFQMAVRAADTRMRAIAANDMAVAWQASSAAAGALLLVDRAREEMRRLMAPPAL